MCLIINRKEAWGESARQVLQTKGRHTVNGNGNAFCQLVSILANKRRDSPEGIDALVIFRKTFGWLSRYDFKLDVVCFGYCANGSRPCIALYTVSVRGKRYFSLADKLTSYVYSFPKGISALLLTVGGVKETLESENYTVARRLA